MSEVSVKRSAIAAENSAAQTLKIYWSGWK